MSTTQIQDAVREKYGEIARSVGARGCCGPTACGCGDPITSNLYSNAETSGLPSVTSEPLFFPVRNENIPTVYPRSALARPSAATSASMSAKLLYMANDARAVAGMQ